MAEDIDAIFAKLTKPQRRALKIKVSAWADGQYAGATRWRDVGRPLLEAGLIAFDPNPLSSETYVTPLGEAVRARAATLTNDGGDNG